MKITNVAKGDSTSKCWGVAWWAEGVQTWYLDSNWQSTQGEAEALKTFLERLDPEIPHRVVKITSQISFSEVQVN